jgi:hypothetical protein
MQQIRHCQHMTSASVFRGDHRIDGKTEHPFLTKEPVSRWNGAQCAYNGFFVEHQAVIGITPRGAEKLAVESIHRHVLSENTKEQTAHLFSLGLQKLVCRFEDNLRYSITRRVRRTPRNLYRCAA